MPCIASPASGLSPRTVLPVAACLVALAALLVAEYADLRWAQVAAKLSASSAFIWAALSWGAAQTPFGQLLLAGLLLCWVGDALLLSRGQTRWFQLGIAAFLLGHVCYALACTRLSLPLFPLVASAALMGLGAWRIHRWLIPHVPGDFRLAVVAYIGVISLMVVLAVTAVAGGGPAALGTGALGFALSDLSVARERFVRSGFVNVAWGLPAYYLSQLTIACATSQAAQAALA